MTVTTTTTTDLYTGNVGFDAIVILSILTDGFFGLDVIAEEAGLSLSRTHAALCLLIGNGKANHHELFGYALAGTHTRS